MFAYIDRYTEMDESIDGSVCVCFFLCVSLGLFCAYRLVYICLEHGNVEKNNLHNIENKNYKILKIYTPSFHKNKEKKHINKSKE